MSWKNIFGSSGELLGRTNEETGDTYADNGELVARYDEESDRTCRSNGELNSYGDTSASLLNEWHDKQQRS